MTEHGHRYKFGPPAGGWPDFAQRCKCGHPKTDHRPISVEADGFDYRHGHGICHTCETCPVYRPDRTHG